LNYSIGNDYSTLRFLPPVDFDVGIIVAGGERADVETFLYIQKVEQSGSLARKFSLIPLTHRIRQSDQYGSK
jgi:hypothetical protein